MRMVKDVTEYAEKVNYQAKKNEQPYIGTDFWSGPANAYRHMMYSSLASVMLGRTHAELWLHAHEWGGKNDPEENQMDRANNWYGLRLADSFGACVCLNGGEQFFHPGPLRERISELAGFISPHIDREINAGRACWIIPGSPPRLKEGCGE